VMDMYANHSLIRHGLASKQDGQKWYLMLIPVNTGFLGLHGVEAVNLIGRPLHEASTAGVLGLSVSSPQSLAALRVVGRVPVFTASVTGDFMRAASNLWLTQTLDHDNAPVLADAALPDGARGPVTVITDSGDGQPDKHIPASNPCLSTRTGIDGRYSVNLAQDLMSEIHARQARAFCLDYRTLADLPAGSEQCKALRSRTLISTLRGWVLGEFLQVLERCPGRFRIVSGEGATNLTEPGKDTLLYMWQQGHWSLTYLGYQSTLPRHRERGDQAEATGADSASALWAATGAALSPPADSQNAASWSAGSIVQALDQDLYVPGVRLYGGSGDLDPPLNRPPFIFKAGDRQAYAPGGGKRPVVMCTVTNVTRSGPTTQIIDHCQRPPNPRMSLP